MDTNTDMKKRMHSIYFMGELPVRFTGHLVKIIGVHQKDFF